MKKPKKQREPSKVHLEGKTPEGGPASDAKAGPTFADRLRQIIGREPVNSFAKRCGVPGSSVRDYLVGAKPRTDKLAKIAIANHVSIHWLATGDGQRNYDAVSQARHDDATRATYLSDAAAGARIGEYVSDLVPRLQRAQAALDSLAVTVDYKVPAGWLPLLLGLLAEEQITELGARRVLEYLKSTLQHS